METRTLGASDIKVSAIGLGLMSMSGIYGNANDEESVRVIHYALDKGISFLDSADMYGWGHNEELLGKALRGRHPVAAVKNEYSLLYRVEGEETLQATRELGITLVPYAPLGRSMLTGSVKGKADLPDGDRRLAHPRFQGEHLDKNVKIVKRLEEMAAEKKCTPAQLVLAWLLAQGKDIVPIPGTKRKQRVDENLDALEVKLSAADVTRISDIAPPGAGAGLRYPADALKRVYL